MRWIKIIFLREKYVLKQSNMRTEKNTHVKQAAIIFLKQQIYVRKPSDNSWKKRNKTKQGSILNEKRTFIYQLSEFRILNIQLITLTAKKRIKQSFIITLLKCLIWKTRENIKRKLFKPPLFFLVFSNTK